MKRYLTAIAFTLLCLSANAQISPAKKDTLNTIRIAENLVSGNTKDVLTSFFQLAANDLTGANKEFKFSSSIFALMLKTNPTLNMNQRYFNRRSFVRNTDVNWALKMDSNYKFNGASFGAKYAIINKRDLAVSKEFISRAGSILSKDFDIHRRIFQLLSASPNADSLRAQLGRISVDTSGMAYKNMSSELKVYYMQALQEFGATGGQPSESFYDSARIKFNDLKNSYASKPIVVVGFDLKTFKDQCLFSDINFYIDGSGGIYQTSGNEFDIELTGKANFLMQDDTIKMVRDLVRQVGHADLGFNLVFRNKIATPTFELKLAAAYDQIFAGRYAGEEEHLFTLNGTARVRITKDITIPMTIKYDPDHSNVFGILSITSNFDGLANLLGSKN